jgi:hypothetical protein
VIHLSLLGLVKQAECSSSPRSSLAEDYDVCVSAWRTLGCVINKRRFEELAGEARNGTLMFKSTRLRWLALADLEKGIAAGQGLHAESGYLDCGGCHANKKVILGDCGNV